MDATERKSWCDYRTFKAVTLRERIFEEFKRLDSSRFNKRASKVIEDILSQHYPCEDREMKVVYFLLKSKYYSSERISSSYMSA